ncbi:hypothetical protein REPUB_Repub09cG0064000 [Reevesia pubescens]
MIMKCAAMVVAGYGPVLRPKCLASNPKINTEQLRYHLDRLHAEAETTRAKELNNWNCICNKSSWFQAITIKETQLIGNIASDSEIGEDDSGPVRIISPKEQAEKDENKNKDFGHDALMLSEDQKLMLHTDDLVEQPANEELEEHEAFPSFSAFNEDNINSSLAAISTYEDFLEHLDEQLNKIEQELVTILNVSTLLLDDEMPKNVKVQQTRELLECILDLRKRITNIRQMKVEIS